MSIATSTRGIVEYLQRNDTLVKQISEAGEEAAVKLKQLAQRIDAGRREAEELIDELGTVEFVVARSSDVRVKQQELLDQIAEVSKDIQRFNAYPQITALLYAQRSEFYLLLANTFNDTVKEVVSFTQQEIDDLNVLLRRSVLDAEARKQKAHLLDAGIQLAKLAFKLAGKLAAV